MKYSEAILITDRRTVNTYTTDDKCRWLLGLDQQIYDDLISKHINTEGRERPSSARQNTELLVPEPYAEDIYINFLQARIAKENEEDAKYNKAITLYNDGYSRFARRYHETHRLLPLYTAFRF